MTTAILILGFLDAKAITSRVGEAKRLRMSPICVAVDGMSPADFTVDKNSQIAECHRLVSALKESGDIDYCLIQKVNLGQAAAIPMAISWFFEIVDSGLILEDDCELIANEAASRYLSDLDRNFSQENVKVVCFSNLWPKRIIRKLSSGNYFEYYDTSFFNSWGWATTASLWKEFSLIGNFGFVKIFQILHNTNLHFYTRLFLAFEWQSHVRTSKRNNKKTWALDFTLFLIEKNIKIKVVGTNLIKHYSRVFASHVNQDPSWMKEVNSEFALAINLNVFSRVMPLNPILESYTAEVVHGAKLTRILKGLVLRIFTVFGFK